VTHSAISGDFRLSSAIETARSESLDAALSTVPELIPFRDQFLKLLHLMDDVQVKEQELPAAIAKADSASNQLVKALAGETMHLP